MYLNASAPGGGGLHSERAVWVVMRINIKPTSNATIPIWRSRRGRQGPSQVEVSEALVLDTNSKGMLIKIKFKKIKG